MLRTAWLLKALVRTGGSGLGARAKISVHLGPGAASEKAIPVPIGTRAAFPDREANVGEALHRDWPKERRL